MLQIGYVLKKNLFYSQYSIPGGRSWKHSTTLFSLFRLCFIICTSEIVYCIVCSVSKDVSPKFDNGFGAFSYLSTSVALSYEIILIGTYL